MKWTVAALVFVCFSADAENTDPQNDEIFLNQADEETVWVHSKERIAQPEHKRVQAKDAEETPGANGDALKAIRQKAGASRSRLGQQGLSLWGAASSDTRFYVDHIPVPRLFHLGGARSILPSLQLSHFDIMPGGAPSRYGGTIGGVIDVRTQRLATAQRPQIAYRADALDTGAQVSSSIGERSAVSVSGRLSLIEQLFTAVAPVSARRFIPVASYWDTQVKGLHQLSSSEELTFTLLAAGDLLNRQLFSVDQNKNASDTRDEKFVRLGATWTDNRPDTFNQATVYVGLESNAFDVDFVESFATQQENSKTVGLLVKQERTLKPWMSLKIGLDGQFNHASFLKDGALTLPAREGDINPLGVGLGNRVNIDKWKVSQATMALFSELNLRLSNFTLKPGVRIESILQNGDRILPVRPTEPEVGLSTMNIFVSPRMRASLFLGKSWTMFSAAGLYVQPAKAEDLSPIFGNPTLVAAKSWQTLYGLKLNQQSWFETTWTIFANKQSRLAVRDAAKTPATARLLHSEGQGLNLGFQADISTTFSDTIQWSTNYTFIRSQRRSSEQSDWRSFDDESRHQLRSSLKWTPTSRIRMGLLVECSTGFPITSVEEATFNTASQTFDPIVGGHNETRLPVFFQTSFRASYNMPHFKVWLDVINVTNHQNVEDIVYASDFQEFRAISGLPFVPTLGAEITL